MSRLRRFGLGLGIACVLAGTAGPAAAGGGRHPLFNDQGTLAWYESLDEAQAVARASTKLIFIESGRRRCGNCQTFVEQVLPAANVRRRISDIAIGLAVDCDETDPRVERILASGIPSPTMLPLCGFVTPELKWVTGWSGYMDASSFCGHLTLAEERYAKIQSYRPRSAPGAPPPPVAPAFVPARPVGDDPCKDGSCGLPPKRVAPTLSPPRPAGPLPISPAPATPPLAKRTPPPPPALPPSQPVPMPTLPASPPLAGRPPPSEPAAPAPALPAPSRATTPAGPVAGLRPPAAALPPTSPAPTRAPAVLTTMDRVRRAADDGRWGEVLKIADAAPKVTTSEKAELDGYVRRANEWVQTSLASVVTSAKEREYTSARRTLTVLATQLDGTTCAGLIDAERGSRAVDRLSAVEQGSPDQLDAPEQIRMQAYAEFRGTRWATLFRGRSAGK